MYGFIDGKRKILGSVFGLIFGVFVCLFLSFLAPLASIGSKKFLTGFLQLPEALGSFRFGSLSAFAETSADVVINEVQYDPEQPAGYDEWKCEWVELYNRGENSVGTSGWYLKDKYFYEKGKTTSLPSFEISAGEFFIIAATEEGFRTIFPDFSDDNIVFLGEKMGNGLANGGDRLVLMSSLNESDVVDKLSWESDTLYNSDLEAKAGHSLERIPFGTGDFVDQSEPTPGSGVTEETKDSDDQEDSEGTDGDGDSSSDEDGTDEGSEKEEAELTVSFSAPSEVTLGEEFEVEVSLENAVSSRSYLVKFGANDGSLDYGQFSKGYTWSDSLDKFLPFSGGGYSWDDFPTVSSGGGTVKARITTSALAGDCAVLVRVHNSEECEDNCDSEVKMVRANEAPEGIDEEEDEDELGDAEEDGGEVLGEETSSKRVGSLGLKDQPYQALATMSPILSATSAAGREATPSTEPAFSTPSGEEGSSKFSVISKIFLGLGGFVVLGVLGFSIAKKRGLV